MIDRIVHHADVLTFKGSSYRVKDTGIEPCPPPEPKTRHNNHDHDVATFRPSPLPRFRPSSTTVIWHGHAAFARPAALTETANLLLVEPSETAEEFNQYSARLQHRAGVVKCQRSTIQRLRGGSSSPQRSEREVVQESRNGRNCAWPS